MRFVSTRTHSVVGIITALALLLAPNIFGFSDTGGAATTVPRLLGLALLVSELITDNGFSLTRIIPMRTHLSLDFGAGLLLALSPWLFGFSDQGTNAWVPHFVVGLFIIGYSMVSETEPDTHSAFTEARHHH